MQDSEPDMSPCSRCSESCCRAVKHMPYQGETDITLFSSILIGGFPDVKVSSHNDTDDMQEERRPFVAEWLIPAEQDACPCLDPCGLCTIYEHRPVSCREFPVDARGNRHSFCSFASEFKASNYKKDSGFTDSSCALDALLSQIMQKYGSNTLNDFLFEEGDTGIPMLYNSYLLCILILSGADILNALSGQRYLLDSNMKNGLEEMTFLIPGTDYCITSPTPEIEINLQYLMARIEQRDLAGRLSARLEDAGILGR